MTKSILGITGNSSNKEPIEIKTKKGTFSVDESLFQSFDKDNNSVTLTNGNTITMTHRNSDAKVMVQDHGNISIDANGANIFLDAKNNAPDNIYVSAKRSTVTISAEGQDEISTRTEDGFNSLITFGDRNVFESYCERPIPAGTFVENPYTSNLLQSKSEEENKSIDAKQIAKDFWQETEEINKEINKMFQDSQKAENLRQEVEKTSDTDEIKKYDELVKNFGNKNCYEEEYNEINWLATKYGFISPAVAIYEKDEAAVANYNAILHKYYEGKSLNQNDIVELNRIAKEYQRLLPFALVMAE